MMEVKVRVGVERKSECQSSTMVRVGVQLSERSGSLRSDQNKTNPSIAIM
jgi:hypothetical protein